MRFSVPNLSFLCRMAPKQKVPEKILPIASHRKWLIKEREDPSHPNFNQPPRVPAKRSRTDPTRAEESGSVPQVVVTPEKVQYVESPSISGGDSTTDKEGIQDDNNDDSSESEADKYGPRDTSLLTNFQAHRAKALALGQDLGCLRLFAERWHLEANSFHFKWGENTITLEDVWRLIGLRVGGDMTVVQGKWEATNVKQVFRDYFYQSDQVYLDLKHGGAGISLSQKGTDASPKYLNFFESKNSDITWSWGAAALVYLYYSLGASLRVNVKALFWIFEHFPKLPGIPKPNDSRAPEYCTRSSRTRTWIREQTDMCSRKLLVSPILFAVRNILKRTILKDNNLHFVVQPSAYKPKYNWADLLSGGKWKDSLITMRGRKVHDGIPACVEGYFEWFKGVSITKLFPTTVNLGENDDRRILGDGGGVGSRVGGGGVGSPVGGGFLQREHVQGQNDDIISRLEEEISNFKLEKEVGESKLLEAIKLMEGTNSSQLSTNIAILNLECSSLKEANKKLSEDVSLLKKTLADLNVQLQAKVDEYEKLASINEKLMDEVVNLQPQPLALNLVSHSEANVIGAED
ncbi:hypothetical protein GIB67_039074 [Kingdonia uniflora]|uniref:Aminotransferase-like plant mobile domain-containing protein n=1 Tax=Kingdonia uniflora TaxID=39325 RepID=A0A7J7LKU4_9MAGN|nr:hypothetical protein GIB67_039074 [Kingdonia uniflora]